MDWSPLLISLATSLTATAVTLVAGLAAAAWRQNRAGAGAALIDGIFILPLVLPPTVVGFLLQQQFTQRAVAAIRRDRGEIGRAHV